MPDVYALARQHKAALLKSEREAASRMIAAYTDVWAAIKAQTDALLKQMQEAKARGEEPDVAWLARQGRLDALMAQVEAQLRGFAQAAGSEITEQQRQAVTAALSNARGQVLQAGADAGLSVQWNALPTGAVENLVGVLHDGSPVVDALKRRFGIVEADEVKKAEKVASALTEIRQAFVVGAALGHNPRQIARKVAAAGAMPLDKALVFSRTEVLRAYRESTREAYLANSDVVKAWRWVATLSGSRTCPMCIAMHGTIHLLDETFGTHPNCRCTQIPVLVGQEEAPFKTGEEWLREQEESVQNDLLGTIAKGAAEAWRSGEIPLSAFVRESRSQKWGLTRRVAGLAEAKVKSNTSPQQ